MTAPLFAGVVGHGRALQLLCATLAADRLAPAYLFAGPEGVGRRTAALHLADLLLSASVSPQPALQRRIRQGNHPDLLWVEPTYQHQGRLVPISAAEAEPPSASTTIGVFKSAGSFRE